MRTPRLTYANVVATLALIVAIAGGSTAIAVSGKVGTHQLRAKAVTAGKLARGSVTASKLAGARLVSDGPHSRVAEAICPEGERLLTGGAAAGGTLQQSEPLSASNPTPRNSWVASVSDGVVTAYALCLITQPG